MSKWKVGWLDYDDDDDVDNKIGISVVIIMIMSRHCTVLTTVKVNQYQDL